MKFDIQKYLEISTIHGLFYSSKRFTFIERIFWIITLAFSLICTSILIAQLIIKIRDFPIVVYLSDQSIPVSEIDFPAVTICPQFFPTLDSGSLEKIFEKFSRFEKHTLLRYYYEQDEFWSEIKDEVQLRNLTRNALRQFDVSLTFEYNKILDEIVKGDIDVRSLGKKILKRLQIVDLITNRNVFESLNFSVPTDDFLDILNEFDKESEKIFKLTWNNDYYTYFSEIITPYGLCFTFSIGFSHEVLHLDKTSDDFHYGVALKLSEVYEDERPQVPANLIRKVSSSNVGLRVTIELNLKFEEIIENDFDGYIFMFNDPYELPSLNSKIIKLNCDESTNIMVDLQINGIDDSIESLEPDERNCYLTNEKILKFFKVYTKNNCEAECLTDFMLNRCGCVEFFMIRNSSTRICSSSERYCFKQAEDDFVNYRKICRCLDPCNFVKYQYEVSPNRIDRNEDRTFMLLETVVKFKTNLFNEFIRKKQFDTFDFLSFVGGIMGLFAGFSALSFVELIYWFTIRYVINHSHKIDNKVYSFNEKIELEDKSSRLQQFFSSYFSESSIHGLKYVVEFSKADSFFWIFFMLSSMTLCFHMISTANEKVPNSRVIAFDDTFRFDDEVNIFIKAASNQFWDYKIPFPAFTIIPPFHEPYDFQRMRGSFASMFANGESVDVAKKAIAEDRFCVEQFNGFGFDLIPYIFDVLKNDSQVDWFQQQISSFNGIYQPKFAEIRTLRGMGYSFNLIDGEEMFNYTKINNRFMYFKNITTEPQNLMKFPEGLKSPFEFYKTSSAALSLTLTEQSSESEVCIPISLMVHDSDYIPTFSARNDFFQFSYQMTVNIEITTEIIRTDEDLRKLSSEVRDCYFEDEKSLRFFKKYSQKNCEVECFRNYTMEVCGCVEFEHPFEDDSELCIIVQKQSMTYCPTKLKNELYGSENFSTEKNCSCLPTCNSVSYNVKYSADFETEGRETTVNVKMNMEDIVVYRRYQQFTFSDVVSYVGGLLGLFAGISMLSIVEFCYFFTIRLGVNFWRIVKGRI